WFAAVAAIQAFNILVPRSVENRADLLGGLVSAWWLLGRNGEVNVPAWLGLFALVALNAGDAAARWMAAAFAAVAAVGVALAALVPATLGPGQHFAARVNPALLSLLLAAAALGALWRPRAPAPLGAPGDASGAGAARRRLPRLARGRNRRLVALSRDRPGRARPRARPRGAGHDRGPARRARPDRLPKHVVALVVPGDEHRAGAGRQGVGDHRPRARGALEDLGPRRPRRGSQEPLLRQR